MEQVFQRLAANEPVAFLIDHSYSGRGIEIDFFGRKTIIPKGAAIAALKTGAPILPMCGVREGDFNYKLIYKDMIDYSITGELEKDIQNILKKCIKAIEDLIKDYPDQWVLIRNAWP